MTIYERIKKRRKELGINADDMAEALGVSRATYYRYESAEVEKMPTTVLDPLSRMLKCSPAYLMGWEDLDSDESAVLDAQISCDPDFKTLYTYWIQLSDIGKKKALDNISDLTKIYHK